MTPPPTTTTSAVAGRGRVDMQAILPLYSRVHGRPDDVRHRRHRRRPDRALRTLLRRAPRDVLDPVREPAGARRPAHDALPREAGLRHAGLPADPGARP